MEMLRLVHGLAAAGLCLSAAVLPFAAIAAPAAAMRLPLPEVSGPVPVTDTSKPFLSAAKSMEAAGYVEEEYFLSGMANVYDWVGQTRKVRVIAGPGRYVTRILVRRPRDAARFSGNIEVSVLNASSGVDLGGPSDGGRMVRQGDVWIGITTKALTAKALQKFDPARYAPLDWTNPAPAAQRCAHPSIIPFYMMGGEANFVKMSQMGVAGSSPETEDGLVWDMLGQLGLLLKSEQRQKILPGFGKPWVYMVGGSQSAIYIRTFLTGFHPRYRTPDGAPVYDGYLATVGPALVRINQCSPDVPLDDPRQKLLPPDVPFISLSSEAEMALGKHTRQPDVVTPKGGIVTYEVAGGSHAGGEIPGQPRDLSAMPSMADFARSGIKMPAVMPGGGMTAMNDFPWAPITRGAYHNLQLWVRKGVLPPQSPGIAMDGALAIKRDELGNALGGLRMPYIDVPFASYRGSTTDEDMTGLMGARKPLPPETLKSLYPDHAAYVTRFAAATDRMLAGRWISPEDAAAMKAAAQAAQVP